MAWQNVLSIATPEVSPDLLPTLAHVLQPPTYKSTGRYICEFCNTPTDRVDVRHICKQCSELGDD